MGGGKKGRGKGPGRSKYGLTWWGGKFLDAFQGIDHANRLPRGVTYANNGSCSQIRIEKNGHQGQRQQSRAVIRASVQGSDVRPYQVCITFQDFQPRRDEFLHKVFDGAGPMLLARLVNRELPESICELCSGGENGATSSSKNGRSASGFQLFPRSWADVTATCSCPDDAVPCKHIAAVLFLTAAEIDKNPFVVFQIHGIDLEEEIDRRAKNVKNPGAGLGGGMAAVSSKSSCSSSGATVNSAGMTLKKIAKSGGGGDAGSCPSAVPSGGLSIGELPVFAELVASGHGDEEEEQLREQDVAEQPRTHAVVDLTKVPFLQEHTHGLLKPQPPFFPKTDFRGILSTVQKHWAKAAEERRTKSRNDTHQNAAATEEQVEAAGERKGKGKRKASENMKNSSSTTTWHLAADDGGDAGNTGGAGVANNGATVPSVSSAVQSSDATDTEAQSAHSEKLRVLRRLDRVQVCLDAANGFVGVDVSCDIAGPTRNDDFFRTAGDENEAGSGSPLNDLPPENLAELEVIAELVKSDQGGGEHDLFGLDKEERVDVLQNCLSRDMNRVFASLEELLDFLQFDVSRAEMLTLCADLQFLGNVARYSALLLKRAALVPQIVVQNRPTKEEMEKVFVRWIPAQTTSEAKEVLQGLAATCPRNLVKLVTVEKRGVTKDVMSSRSAPSSSRAQATNGNAITAADLVRDRGTASDNQGSQELLVFENGASVAAALTTTVWMGAKEQLSSLVALVVKHSLAAYFCSPAAGENKKPMKKGMFVFASEGARERELAALPPAAVKHAKADGDKKILPLFFDPRTDRGPTTLYGDRNARNHFEFKSIPKAIHVWLSRLFFTEKDFRIRLLVKHKSEEEEGDHFSLAVEVEILAPASTTGATSSPSDVGATATEAKSSKDAKGWGKGKKSRAPKEEKEVKVVELAHFLREYAAHPQLLDVLGTLNLLSEYIPGFEAAIAKTSKGKPVAGAATSLPSAKERELNEIERADPDLARAMRASLLEQVKAKDAAPGPDSRADSAESSAVAIANRPEFDLLNFHYSQFADIFLGVFPLLESLGVKIILPKALKKRSRAQLRVTVKPTSAAGVHPAKTTSADSASSLPQQLQGFADLVAQNRVAFEWTVAVGERDVAVSEFEKLVQEQTCGLVKLGKDKFFIGEPAELKQLLAKAKKALKEKKTLTKFEVAQAAMGCPNVLGRDTEVCVHPEIAKTVHDMLDLGGNKNRSSKEDAAGGKQEPSKGSSKEKKEKQQQFDENNFRLYARPAVIKCINEVGEELLGKIYPDVLEVACVHDGQTFDAERELNGLRRMTPYQDPVVKLLVSVQGKKAHFDGVAAAVARAVQEDAPAGGQLLKSRAGRAGNVGENMKLDILFKNISGMGLESSDYHVVNPCTRAEIDKQHPPRLNYRVQPFIDALEPVLEGGGNCGAQVVGSNSLMPGRMQQLPAAAGRELPPSLDKVSDAMLSYVFSLLKKAARDGVAPGKAAGMGQEGAHPKSCPIGTTVSPTGPVGLELFQKLSGTQILQPSTSMHEICPAEKDVLFKELSSIVQRCATDPGVLLASASDHDAPAPVPAGVQPPINQGESSDGKKEAFPVPQDLQANLREYQVRGYQWLCHNIAFGFGCILADDMGLGKTLQVLTTILHFRNDHRKRAAQAGNGANASKFRVLVICPTSLVENWCSEAQKFTPSLRVAAYAGAQREAVLASLLGRRAGPARGQVEAAPGANVAAPATEATSVALQQDGAAAEAGAGNGNQKETSLAEDLAAVMESASAASSKATVTSSARNGGGTGSKAPSAAAKEKAAKGKAKAKSRAKAKAAGGKRAASAANLAAAATAGANGSPDFSSLDAPEVVVTSLGTVRSDAAQLSKIHWALVVLDEAQAIKNPKSQQAKAVKSIPADSYLAMSGTPVENRLLEYWSIFDFVSKGYLGITASIFSANYARPIEKDQCRETLEQFHRVTRPFLLRRLKTDKSIIKDLPDKVYCDEKCALTKEQAALYTALVERCMGTIEGNGGRKSTKFAQGAQSDAALLVDQVFEAEEAAAAENAREPAAKRRRGDGCAADEEQSQQAAAAEEHPMDVDEQGAGGDKKELSGMQRKGAVLKMITCLKQLCNHPSLYLKDLDSKRNNGAASPGGADAKSKKSRLKKSSVSLNMGDHVEAASRSGKCEILMQLLENILEGDPSDKVLIFTQYAGMGVLLQALIMKHFPEYLDRVPFFHGGCSREERSKIVRDFQQGYDADDGGDEGEKPRQEGEGGENMKAKKPSRARVLIISLRAGGTGLNLTAASHVVHFDHWWNPAVEDQATDRAYRIGQKKKVFVYRLITRGSLEERIMKMTEKKRNLQEITVTSVEQRLTEMSAEELRDLVSLRGDLGGGDVVGSGGGAAGNGFALLESLGGGGGGASQNWNYCDEGMRMVV